MKNALLSSKTSYQQRRPIIPCLIGELFVSNALADLGASINLMPYAVFSRLGLGEPKPTRMSIQLVDRSVKYPRGIVENMLVKIDKFVFPVDFVILDMDEDKSVLLILGRSFLATARALIDVCTGKIILRVEDEEVTFDIGRSMKHPQQTNDSVYYIDVCESIVSCHIHETIEKEACNTQLIEKKTYSVIHDEQSTEDQEASEHQETYETVDRKLEPKAKPSVEDPPVLELIELPSHLEYAFLDGES
ncbi:uncharacterized protein LOC143634747 [Bidens hawaiensis]|uniref:uncharacterized protein LOC143634747 n=1 Tax=Bidens hawaiensis TaxID=980011 RepID=UPI00404B8723